MKEVEIEFEREGVSGLIPVGTYLYDAARRIGVRFLEQCNTSSGEHHCEVEVTSGGDRLTSRTSAEDKYFEGRDNTDHSRLACQARVDKEGEIKVKTKESETVKDKPNGETEEEYRKRFAEMPLEKKISELVQLEAIALSDTLSFVVNSPYTIGDKIMGLMAQFGLRKEQSERESSRPEEHRPAPQASETDNGSKAKEKAKDQEKREES